jgi:hypothetical protein
MNDLYQETHDVQQIPWAKNVKVTGAHYFTRTRKLDSVELKIEEPLWVKASVIANGNVRLDVDSKENIKEHMSKSPELRRSLFKYFEKEDNHPAFSDFISTTLDWVNGVPHVLVEEPPYGETPGVLDWIPGEEKHPVRIGKTGYYGAGKIKKTIENWIGNDFTFVHFVKPDKEEGFVILWEGSEKPEVWVGDVHDFILNNREPFEEVESYRHYNELFENGLLWALDYMGLFEGNNLPEWAIEMIRKDPDLLWPDLVERLFPIRERLHPYVEWAIDLWVQRRQEEAEKASGQLRFWYYPGKT